MTFDPRSGGHSFEFSSDVCAICGMTRKHFEDHGRPQCAAKKPKGKEPMRVPDYDSAKQNRRPDRG